MERTLAKLTPNTLTDSCYRVLKEAILNLDIEPGAPLIEHQIASQLGISKTPVREALAKLSSEGFVTGTAARKTFVAGLSSKMIRDIYAVRLLLEPENVREVTSRVTDDDIVQLQRLADRSKAAFRAGATQDYLHGNREFHRFLISLAENQLLLTTYDGIYDHAYRVRAAIYRSEIEFNRQEFAEQGFLHHDEIVDALRRRAPELAARSMRADVGLFLEMTDTPTVSRAMEQLGVDPIVV